MTATTANLLIDTRSPASLQDVPLAAEKVYQGSLLFIDAATGYGTGDDNGGANQLAGVVKEEIDNSGGSAGDLSAEVYQDGVFYHLVTSGLAQADVAKKVYAIDNQTIQLSATSASLIGTIVEFVSATKVGVRIDVQLA